MRSHRRKKMRTWLAKVSTWETTATLVSPIVAAAVLPFLDAKELAMASRICAALR